MRLANKVLIVYNDYNEYGEEMEINKISMKCLIVEYKKHNSLASTDAGINFHKTYDLEIVTGKKNFSPYSDLFSNESITIEYDGREFMPVVISELHDMNGKIKQYVISCDDAKNR